MNRDVNRNRRGKCCLMGDVEAGEGSRLALERESERASEREQERASERARAIERARARARERESK